MRASCLPKPKRDLLATRPEFPTLAKGVHLISHSLGAMPARRARVREPLRRRVGERLDRLVGRALAARRARRWGISSASVLGVAPGTVAMLPNVSIVQAIVASCFDFRGPRNKIVYDDLNFSTVHYVWQGQARRGAEVVVVKSEDGIHPPIEKLLEAIDERTLLVPISHVLFRSSAMYDARRVIERAHAVGAMVLLDVYQSAGTVPLELGEWGCDLACGGLGEVGLRRAGRGVPVRAAGPASRSSSRWRPAGSATPSRSPSTWGPCATPRTRGG